MSDRTRNKIFIILSCMALISFIAILLILKYEYNEKKAKSIESRIETSKGIHIGMTDENINIINDTSNITTKKHKNIYGIARYKYEYVKDKSYVVLVLNGEEYKVINEEPNLYEQAVNNSPNSNLYILYFIDTKNNVTIENVISNSKLHELKKMRYIAKLFNGLMDMEEINDFIK